MLDCVYSSMVHNKILSKVTLSDLKKYAINDDYDWRLEILPNLDRIIDRIVLNTDIRSICCLSLAEALGTPIKRQEAVKERDNDIYQP